jgi:hypothetical protein
LGRGDLADIARAGAIGALQRADPTSGGGLYDGAAGVAVAVLQVGAALGDDRLTAEGLELLRAAIATPPVGNDVISGTAGLILALLAAAATSAKKCDRLIARQWRQREFDLALHAQELTTGDNQRELWAGAE